MRIILSAIIVFGFVPAVYSSDEAPAAQSCIEASGELETFGFEENFNLGRGLNYDEMTNYATMYGAQFQYRLPDSHFMAKLSGIIGPPSSQEFEIDYFRGAGAYRLDNSFYWEIKTDLGYSLSRGFDAFISHYYYHFRRDILLGNAVDHELNWMQAGGLGFRTENEIGSSGLFLKGEVTGYFVLGRTWEYTDSAGNVSSYKSPGIGYFLSTGLSYHAFGPVYSEIIYSTVHFYDKINCFWEISRVISTRINIKF